MPDFELEDLLQTVGPTASLIFAAWIFRNYLSLELLQIEHRPPRPAWAASGSPTRRIRFEVDLYRRHANGKRVRGLRHVFWLIHQGEFRGNIELR